MKRFFLTFDGAPHPPNTNKLLDVLSKYNVKATFFIEGHRMEKEWPCAKRIIDEGHAIGNHSYNHPDFKTLSLQQCIEEVESADDIIQKKLGIKTPLLRPPNGSISPEAAKYFEDKGYKIMLWSYSVKDWTSREASETAERILDGLKEDEAIIVLHDHVELNPQVLEIVLPVIKERGYEFAIPKY